jgi:IS4 transposase
MAVNMKNAFFWDIKNSVRTSQETHYSSITESNRLMLFKIRGVHGGDYEVCRLQGYKNPVCTSQEAH